MANIKDKMLYFVGNKLLKDRQGGCRQDVP